AAAELAIDDAETEQCAELERKHVQVGILESQVAGARVQRQMHERLFRFVAGGNQRNLLANSATPAVVIRIFHIPPRAHDAEGMRVRRVENQSGERECRRNKKTLHWNLQRGHIDPSGAYKTKMQSMIGVAKLFFVGASPHETMRLRAFA